MNNEEISGTIGISAGFIAGVLLTKYNNGPIPNWAVTIIFIIVVILCQTGFTYWQNRRMSGKQ